MTALCMSIAGPVLARDASCNYLAGQVVFQDTLYGIAIGSVMGGLGALATEEEPSYQRPVATGALLGSALGLGFGLFEVTQRDCQLVEGREEPRSEHQSLLVLRPVSTDDLSGAWQLSFSLRF